MPFSILNYADRVILKNVRKCPNTTFCPLINVRLKVACLPKISALGTVAPDMA